MKKFNPINNPTSYFNLKRKRKKTKTKKEKQCGSVTQKNKKNVKIEYIYKEIQFNHKEKKRKKQCESVISFSSPFITGLEKNEFTIMICFKIDKKINLNSQNMKEMTNNSIINWATTVMIS